MEQLIGQWGWISIDEIKSANFRQYIHPETLKQIEAFEFSDAVFQCTDYLPGDYLQLRSTEAEIIVKKEVFRPMPVAPVFKPLDAVKFYNSKGLLEFGIIKNINWHNRDHKHIYLVEVNGSLKSKRYSTEDLEKNEHL